MKFLNNIIRFVVFVIVAFGVFYLAKALGFTYAPDEDNLTRNIIRVVLICIILGAAWFIWRIDFLKRNKQG